MNPNNRSNTQSNSITEVPREMILLSLTINNVKQPKHHAFNYDARNAYEDLPEIRIGKISIECQYCKAMRFVGESKNMCCSSGRISMPQNERLPQPLLNLINNTHPKSKKLLPLLRKYNACFNMTSFQTTAKRKR